MTSKATIFDHFARPLVEFSNIPTTPRNWILNAYGRAEFSAGFDPTLPQSAQLVQEKYFQFGNLIHIEHIPDKDENGVTKGKLPDWTGIILPEQKWDQGIIHATAYSAEAILCFRAMPYASVKGTPREVFTQILNHAHARAKNITIQPGVLDDLPTTFPDDLRLNAYDHILKLIKNAGMDWSVTGSINAKGNLEFFANLYIRKGYDTGLDLTNLNTELAGPLLSIQGTPSNQVFGYSQAQTRQGRYTAEAIHQEAYDDYGPLQLNQVFIGLHDQTSVYNAVTNRAAQRGRPVWKIKRTALDYAGTFNALDTGNMARVRDTGAGFNPNGNYGFEKTVRMFSLDYNDLTNKCGLNLEII